MAGRGELDVASWADFGLPAMSDLIRNQAEILQRGGFMSIALTHPAGAAIAARRPTFCYLSGRFPIP